MINCFPPAIIFFLGAILLLFLRGNVKKVFLLLVPLIGLINLSILPEGVLCVAPFLEYDLIFCKIDRLSLLFGYIFHIITFLGILYSFHVDDDSHHLTVLVYGGSVLGVVFAGDLITFFCFWEFLTLSSIFLIWTRRTKAALEAGFRALLVHTAGGLCLLAGIILKVQTTGSTEITLLTLSDLSSYLIFIGFGMKCAWPFLHPWLPDAYPESSITAAVFLSAFTTKTAVYALARFFPGTEALIWIGVAMTAFPIFYAVIENDLRRVLSYSLINQVGFMVCGIGIGTPLAINGATAHAFSHILYKGLLFMSIGAVMYRTGKVNATDLGGLYKSMPLTCLFCVVGAASISAFPLFSGFVSKSMVVDAAALGSMEIVWFILLFASAGVFHHAGIKVPYFAFFSHDSGLRTKEAPLHMLLAMGITAFLCIFIGSYPGLLYNILPYPTDFQPYSTGHVIGQFQLLFYSALAFILLLMSGIYPPEIRCTNLDFDWFYRKGGRIFYNAIDKGLNGINRISEKFFVQGLVGYLSRFSAEGPAKIAVGLLTPFWILQGANRNILLKKKAKLHRALLSGTSPVGISVGAASLFILILFLLM